MGAFDSCFPFRITMLAVNLPNTSALVSRFMNNIHNTTGNGTSSPYRKNESENIHSLLKIFKIKFHSMFYV